jgi:hypothetical protein
LAHKIVSQFVAYVLPFALDGLSCPEEEEKVNSSTQEYCNIQQNLWLYSLYIREL